MSNSLRWISFLVLMFPLTCSAAVLTSFNWQAVTSAPKNYPMEILVGNLVYPASYSGSPFRYLSSKTIILRQWGEGLPAYTVTPESGFLMRPLPRILSVSYFSYIENQFYRGKFKLPYKKMIRMFKAGYFNSIANSHVTYEQIIVGVAPGGTVSVWLKGMGKTAQIFTGTAKKRGYCLAPSSSQCFGFQS